MDYSQQELSSLANRLADKIQFRRPSIGTHTDYVLGKRGKLKFASKEFKRYMSDRFSDFSDNWCLPVAQAPVERIKFKGFVPYDDVKLGTGIMKCLDRNDFERGLQEAALMMTTTGRAFALVTQVDGRARITFEHPDSAAVIYDARTGQPSAGFLIQQGDDKEYGTLMLPGWTVSMERKKMLDLTDQRVPPDVYGWKMNDPQPTGLDTIPLREFRNQMLLDNAPISDIAHVESMQDTVNVVWAYLLNALDYASLPARVILGGDPLVEPVYNEEGQQVGEKPIELDKQVLERIYQFTGDNVNLGEWSSSNLNVFIPVIEKAVEHIAAETRTPVGSFDSPLKERAVSSHPATIQVAHPFSVLKVSIYCDNTHLRTEIFCHLFDNLWIFQGRRVQRHLVGPGTQQPVDIGQRMNAAPYGKGNINAGGNAFHQIGKGIAPLIRSRNIEIDQFVGSLPAIKLAQRYRVAGFPKVHKVGSLYRLAIFHIKAGYNTFCQHNFQELTVMKCEISPSDIRPS